MNSPEGQLQALGRVVGQIYGQALDEVWIERVIDRTDPEHETFECDITWLVVHVSFANVDRVQAMEITMMDKRETLDFLGITQEDVKNNVQYPTVSYGIELDEIRWGLHNG